MKTSPAGIALIKAFESCKLKAYPDPKTGGAPWTCGWGATGADIGPDTVWTQAQADARLAADIAEREAMVLAAVTHPMTQGEFDAFVSIVFNVGKGSATKDGILRLKSGNPSTLLRKFNAGDIGGAETQWLLWVSPGSSVEHGLFRRRQAELALFRTEAKEVA
jgi:lysozyme